MMTPCLSEEVPVVLATTAVISLLEPNSMPISWNEIRQNAIRFAADWEGANRESAEKQTFWNEFFEVFGIRRRTVAAFEDVMGERLRGWRTCAASHNTIDLLLEHFDFEWDASIWNDDLPYMIEGHGRKFLEIPFSHYSDAAYSVEMHNTTQPINPFNTWASNTPETIFRIMKSQFDALYERGAEQAVLMPMTVHDYITGRPARSKALIQ